MSEARQLHFRDLLQKMLAEHSILCQELEAIRDLEHLEWQVDNLEEDCSATHSKKDPQEGLVEEHLEDMSDNPVDDDDDEGTGAQALAQAGAATRLDTKIQGTLEELESDLRVALNKLEGGLENLRANFTTERHAATSQTLARSRELYDEFKVRVGASSIHH